MNPHFRKILAAVCCSLAALLTGCAMAPKATEEPVVSASSIASPRQPSAADELLAEFARLQSMPAAELARRREAARDAFERDPAMFRRLSYVLTIFVAPTSPGDDDRLLTLVDPLVNASDDTTRTLGVIVQGSALSRKRIRDEAVQTQRSRIAANQRRDDREPEVRSLKQKVEDLEKQLVALKSIDRSVTRR